MARHRSTKPPSGAPAGRFSQVECGNSGRENSMVRSHSRCPVKHLITATMKPLNIGILLIALTIDINITYVCVLLA